MKKLRPMYFQVEKVEKVKHFSVLTLPDLFWGNITFRLAGVGNFLVSRYTGILYSGISERIFKAKSPTKLTSARKGSDIV